MQCTPDEMVWLKPDPAGDDQKTLCRVVNTLPNSNREKISIVVRPTYTVEQVYKNIETQFNYSSFDLVLDSKETKVALNDKRKTLLYDVPGFQKNTKNTLLIMPSENSTTNLVQKWMDGKKKTDDNDSTNLSALTPDSLSDMDLALGASASPTETEPLPAIPQAPALPMYDVKMNDQKIKLKLYSSPKSTSRYVGLVNQAMTCYLNSLLQALFMTPEFRNALYHWEFDGIDEAKSIPYQLQKLFLNLQTSQKAAVETTDLTRSFGWDSTEAWQQHDIQELCRVMFDALEQKFKNTDQADLINRLYEGKMIDYVKCLECCTEKSREDTFLDIPLPVRPFGSTVAYGSIEEALRAFVQPETLDGNNQYLCEKCNKKCDAHKGLKFKNFPYILTLHLKRFDFDYQTLHRIKLNDKVTFPQTLNLNSFINATDVETFGANHSQTNGFISSASSEHDNTESLTKCDDSSTTDSGAAMEEDNCSGIATTASSSHNDNDLQDDDEGIDVSANADNRLPSSNESGPYIYELFAIMIHSGSASGGHYYAYIKDFDNSEWYCFNDQTVSPITQEDIQKSFGGGSFKAYYSSIYSSSTNAYMLMYRQIEPKQNATAIKATEFPEHINQLLKRLDDKEEETRKQKASESDIIKPKVYFYNPKLRTTKFTKVYTSKSSTLEEVLESAHGLLDVRKFAPLSRCRLVAYDHLAEEILYSLEGLEKDPMENFLSEIDYLLEVRGENEEFEIYEPNGVTTRVYKVDMKTNDVDGPYLIRAIRNSTIESFKKLAAKKMKLKWKEMVVAIETYLDGAILRKDADTDTFYPQRRIFVTCAKRPTAEECEQFLQVVNTYNHLMYLYVTVPIADKETLQLLAIPPYVPRSQQPSTPKQSSSDTSKQLEGGDVVDAVMMNAATDLTASDANVIGASGDFKRSSPLPPHSGTLENGCCNAAASGGTESNSEDSSLSDGDRTLVESAPHNLSHSSTPSHSPQLSSPEDENDDKVMIGCREAKPFTSVSDDEDCFEADTDLYFRAIRLGENEDPEHMNSIPLLNGNASDSDETTPKEKVQSEFILKVLVDTRMRIGTFKRHLEPHIHVLSEYFRIVQKQSNDLKHFYLDMSEKMRSFKDGDKLHIELGRNLKKGEHKAKLYYLKLSEITNEVGKLEPVCERVFNAGSLLNDVKRDLIEHLHKLDSKYETLTMENCRLWERSGKNPLRILPAGNKLTVCDLGLSISCEIVLQECENGVSPVTGAESITLFVRRWHPSTLELDPFQEITLERDIDVRKLLSEISDIPEDKVAYSKVTSSFPATNISLLNINSSMSWFTNAATTDNYPIMYSNCGSVYFYKNSSELPKELTPEDRRELQNKEKARLERLGASTISAYSPRRERALKIYLDTSPKGRDD